MRTKVIDPRTLAAVMALAFITSVAKADVNDEAAVKEANSAFYDALNTMFAGDLEPMKKVWSHSDRVTYMGPDGGFQVGWTQVLAEWQKQAAMKLGGKVEPSKIVINVGKDLAIVHNYEKGQNRDKNGKTVEVSIRATNIFRKEGGKWKMIGHHTDMLPFLQP